MQSAVNVFHLTINNITHRITGSLNWKESPFLAISYLCDDLLDNYESLSAILHMKPGNRAHRFANGLFMVYPAPM